MQRRNFLKGASASVVVSLLAGCSGVFGNTNSNTNGQAARTQSNETTQNPPNGASASTTGPPPGDVSAEVVRQKFVAEKHPSGMDYYMTAVVKNTGKVPLAGPEVSVEFYDTHGRVIGTTSEEITHLGRGQRWDVRVEYSGVDDDPDPDSGVVEFGTTEPWSSYSLPKELEVSSESLENASGSATETTETETTTETTETTTETTETTTETTDKPLVSGEVKNTSDSSVSAITGYADFIAENGHVLETGETSIEEIESGETHEFEIEYPGFDDSRIKRVSDDELYFVL